MAGARLEALSRGASWRHDTAMIIRRLGSNRATDFASSRDPWVPKPARFRDGALSARGSMAWAIAGLLACGPSLLGCGDDTPAPCADGDPGCAAADADKDGFVRCGVLDGAAGCDCDDDDATIHPAATETCRDGIDSNCDGTDNCDADGDGVGADLAVGGTPDCDDTNPLVFPGALETCDTIDNDCDGVADEPPACPITCTGPRDCAPSAPNCVDGTCSCGDAGPCPITADGTTQQICCDDACQDPRSDEACGVCGNACGENSACVDQRCTCSEPFVDCQGIGNQCVTDLESDVSHCGRCGNACARPHATTACETSECRITACEDVWDDCDGMEENGCEQRLRTLVHCGACDNPCALDNATPTCRGGTCTVEECNGRWGNCDGRPANGCETNLNNTEEHCGACDVACGSGETCVRGVCVCGPREGTFGGGAACPSQLSCCDNRCVNLNLQEANCGACGVTCGAGETCRAGACCCGGRCGTTAGGASCMSSCCVADMCEPAGMCP